MDSASSQDCEPARLAGRRVDGVRGVGRCRRGCEPSLYVGIRGALCAAVLRLVGTLLGRCAALANGLWWPFETFGCPIRRDRRRRALVDRDLDERLGSARGGVLEGQRRSTDASLAVLLGVAGPWELRNLYRGDPNDLTELFDRLKKDRKSLYADPRHDWIGKAVADVLQPGQARSCRGEIDLRLAEEIYPRSEWRISGWAWDVDADAPPRSVVLVDHRA